MSIQFYGAWLKATGSSLHLTCGSFVFNTHFHCGINKVSLILILTQRKHTIRGFNVGVLLILVALGTQWTWSQHTNNLSWSLCHSWWLQVLFMFCSLSLSSACLGGACYGLSLLAHAPVIATTCCWSTWGSLYLFNTAAWSSLSLGMLNLSCSCSQLLEIFLCALTCWINLCSLCVDFPRPGLGPFPVYGNLSGDQDESGWRGVSVCRRGVAVILLKRRVCVDSLPSYPPGPFPNHLYIYIALWFTFL